MDWLRSLVADQSYLNFQVGSSGLAKIVRMDRSRNWGFSSGSFEALFGADSSVATEEPCVIELSS